MIVAIDERTVLLQVLLARSDKLDSNKLVSVFLVSGTRHYGVLSPTYPRFSNREMMGPMSPR
jgi:hypothetical protein